MGRLVTRSWIVVLAALAAWGGHVKGDAPRSPREVFDLRRAHTIEIRLSRQGWDLMQPGAGARLVHSGKPATTQVSLRKTDGGFAYVRAEVAFDGEKLSDVGLRFKGNYSYSVSAHTVRRPMKLDFDRFVAGQRLAGISTLNLSNQALDVSQVREALAYHLFRKVGVPAPRTGFALVYLSVEGLYSREYLGLYTLIEDVDHHFLKRHFGNTDGLFLKPSRMRGLAYLGETWEPYAPRYQPRGGSDPALQRRIIALARLIHRTDDATFAREIEAYLDVDEMLRYVAVTGAMANFDSFVSTGHNYYLYVNPVDGRATIIPWDMNMTFGGYTWVGTEQQIEHLSVIHPYVDYNHVIERILAIPSWRRIYLAHVRELAEGPFSPGAVQERLAEMSGVFRAAGDAARAAGKLASPSTQPATRVKLIPPPLMQFVQARTRSMVQQVEGKEQGYVPGFWDPQLVPQEWSRGVLPANALMAALDRDHDGRISHQEAAAAIEGLFKAAGVSDGGSLDQDRLATALARVMTQPMRRCAGAQAWAKWTMRVAGARGGRVDTEQLLGVYRRMLAAEDVDFDGLLCGRELLEGICGIGVP